MRQTPDIQESLVAMLEGSKPSAHAKALVQLRDAMDTLGKIVYPQPGILPAGGQQPAPLNLLDVLEQSVREAQAAASLKFPTLVRQSFSVNGKKRKHFDAVLAEQLQVIKQERIRQEIVIAQAAADGNAAAQVEPSTNLQELIQRLSDVPSLSKLNQLVLHGGAEPANSELQVGAMHFWYTPTAELGVYLIHYKYKNPSTNLNETKEITVANVRDAMTAMGMPHEDADVTGFFSSLVNRLHPSFSGEHSSFTKEQQALLFKITLGQVFPAPGDAFNSTLEAIDVENPAIVNLVALDNLQKACDALKLLCTDCAQIDARLTPRADPLAPPGTPPPAVDAYSQLYSAAGLVHLACERLRVALTREHNAVQAPLNAIQAMRSQIQQGLKLFEEQEKKEQEKTTTLAKTQADATEIVTSLQMSGRGLAQKIQELLALVPPAQPETAERQKLLALQQKWQATQTQLMPTLEALALVAGAVAENNAASQRKFSTQYLATIAPINKFLTEALSSLTEVDKSLAAKREAIQKKQKNLQLLDELTARAGHPNPLIAIQMMLHLANRGFTPAALAPLPGADDHPLGELLSTFEPGEAFKEQIDYNIRVVHRDGIQPTDAEADGLGLPADARDSTKTRAEWRHLAIEKLKELHQRLENVLKEEGLALTEAEKAALEAQKTLAATELKTALQKQYQYYNRMLSVPGFVPPELLDEFQGYKQEAADDLKKLGVELEAQNSPPSLADVATVMLPENWVDIKDGKIRLCKPGRDPQTGVQTSDFVLDGLTRAELLDYFMEFVKKEMREKGENMDAWHRAAANGTLELKGYPSICFRADGSVKIRAKNRQQLIDHIKQKMQGDKSLHVNPLGAPNEATAAQPAANGSGGVPGMGRGLAQ